MPTDRARFEADVMDRLDPIRARKAEVRKELDRREGELKMLIHTQPAPDDETRWQWNEQIRDVLAALERGQAMLEKIDEEYAAIWTSSKGSSNE